MPTPASLLEMMLCKCRESSHQNMCHCRILVLECTDLCKCSGSCNNETETNNIESDIDDKSDGYSKHNEASDANSEEEN